MEPTIAQILSSSNRRSHNFIKKETAAFQRLSLFYLRFVIPRVFFHGLHRFFGRLLIEKFQGLRHDLREILRFALIFILVSLQAPFKVDQTAFLEIFLANFAEASPGFNVGPFG